MYEYTKAKEPPEGDWEYVGPVTKKGKPTDLKRYRRPVKDTNGKLTPKNTLQE